MNQNVPGLTLGPGGITFTLVRSRADGYRRMIVGANRSVDEPREFRSAQVPRLSLRRGTILLDALSEIRRPVATSVRFLVRRQNASRGSECEVYLKNGNASIECQSREELQFVLMAIGVTKQLRGNSCEVDEISSLVRLARALSHELRSKYDVGEIARGVGAVPGLKDVLLYQLIRLRGPERVIETGVAQGVSSTFILAALRKNGHGSLTSIDLPNYNPNGLDYPTGGIHRDKVWVKPELGTGWVVPHDLRPLWSLILGRSSDVLPRVEGRVDLFFHDSEHSYENMSFELEWAFAHLSMAGIICCDDIHWNRAFPDFVARHRSELSVVSSVLKGVCVKSDLGSAPEKTF